MAMIVVSTRGTLGDHVPCVGLGQALQAAGHRVRLAVNEAQRGLVEAAGLEFRAVGPMLGPEQARAQAWVWDQWNNPLAERIADDFGDPGAAAELDYTRRLDAVCADADLLIASSTTAHLAALIAERRQIGWIHASPMAMAFDDPESLPDPVWYAEFIDRLRRDFGLPVGTTAPRPLAEILASSGWFSQPHAGRRVVQTGFWFVEPPGVQAFTPPPRLARFLHRRHAPLVLSMSSQPVTDPARVVDLHLRAAELLDRPLIVQHGWADLRPTAAATADPDRVLFIGGVPHSWLFPHAAAVITHGGIGTLAAAMRAGCPIAVEPYGNDQIFNARRVRAIGIGTGIHPHRATADKLAAILDGRVLRPETRSRAETLSTRIAAEPGLARAVRTITAHLPATGTHPPAGSARDATYLHSNDSPSARDTTIDTPGWADQINDAELDVSGTADLTVVPARSAE